MTSFKLSDLLKAKSLSLVALRSRTWIQEFGDGYCPALGTWECKSVFVLSNFSKTHDLGILSLPFFSFLVAQGPSSGGKQSHVASSSAT